MKKQILVLGSVNADHVLRVNQFPRPGETVTGSQYSIVGGGKGANQAVACARLGGQTRFMACVGVDAFGGQIIRQLDDDGIDTGCVEQIEGVNTGVALIFVDDNAENCIGIAGEANHYLNATFVERHQQVIKTADYLLMQLETPEDGLLEAATLAIQHDTTVVLNPTPGKPLSEALLACIDIITPNQTEAEVLTGVKVEDPESAAHAASVLHGRGIATVVITMGSQGAFISRLQDDDTVTEMVSAFHVAAVDTTAAGDTFNGGLLVALTEGMDMVAATRFANGCGALAVKRHGAQTSIPTRAEADDFVANVSGSPVVSLSR